MVKTKDERQYTAAFGWFDNERHFMLRPAQLILLGYIAFILLGSFMLLLPGMVTSGNHLTFIDALFTSTSAICVTGLTVVDTATFYSFWGQLVILLLIQGGGLGYMTLTTLIAIALHRRIEYRDRLALKESFSLETPGGVVRFALGVLKYTFAIEGIGVILLFGGFLKDFPPIKALYFAVFHGISAFCNAGFSVFSNNLENYALDPIISLTICFLIIFGGIGFMVIRSFLEKKRITSLHGKVVLRVTLLLLIIGTVGFLLFEWNNPATIGRFGIGGKVLASFFQAVTPRTAGFNTIRNGYLRPISLFLTMFLMFIGASPGGTGGGIKTTVFAILLGMIKGSAQEKNRVELFHRRISPDTVFRAVTQALIPFFLVSIITMIILSYQVDNPVFVLFEVISAFGTVGLSTGITPTLWGLSKFLLVFMMYYGKVGLLGLAIYPAKKEGRECILYPEENIQL
ncbi:MAG: TrkH family potassium uptake protein [Atribacterota bacterium]